LNEKGEIEKVNDGDESENAEREEIGDEKTL
jgi:hypothetical protein